MCVARLTDFFLILNYFFQIKGIYLHNLHRPSQKMIIEKVVIFLFLLYHITDLKRNVFSARVVLSTDRQLVRKLYTHSWNICLDIPQIPWKIDLL